MSSSLSKFLVLILFAGFSEAYSQHQGVLEKPHIWRGKTTETEDSTSVLHAFKLGQTHGHFRHFFMATDNAPGLQDYWANASGGGLRFESAKFHGWQVGISGFFIFNSGSMDLSLRDSITNMSNRYEIGLFDLTDFHNKNDIDRLEEFFIRYNYKNSNVTFGKILINTPLINLQDGRMRPTGVEGAWFDFREIKKLKIEGGYLYGFSPRSTVRWYKGARSIGVYPTGVNPDGTRSDYSGNLESKGVGVIGVHYEPKSWVNLHFWNYYIDNIQNSAMFQADFNAKRKKGGSYIAGLQTIRQDAVNDGGNPDPSKTYMSKGAKSMTFGAKLGIKTEKNEFSLNYNRLTSHGRYLFPREWGRDPFYTFMPRERNDGFGNVHAFVGRYMHKFLPYRSSLNISAGYFHMPDVKDFELNKYGMPSYAQVNLDLRHSLGWILTGIDIQYLLVYKHGIGETYNDQRFVLNKVDMFLHNLILNYHF